MIRRGHRCLAVLLAGVVFAAVAPLNAGASPTDDLLTRAAALQRDLLANGENIAALAERYNGAVLRRDLALRQVQLGSSAIARLAEQREVLADKARRQAAALYRGSGRGTPLGAAGIPGTLRFGRSSHYGDLVARRQNGVVDAVTRVEGQLANRAQKLEAFRSHVEQESALVVAAKARALELEKVQETLLAGASGELRVVLRLRRAAEDPGAARLEEQLRLLGVDALPGAPSPRASLAVAYAIAQLGKPYVFAAKGPDTFDCSGLTLMAWRQAGVSMAHFAASQYASFPRVSIEALEPGDLVFFKPTIGHVGIYIGGGQMIHAPRSGDVVRVASIFRPNLVGAVRPG